MMKVRESFETKVINRSKLDIYKIKIPPGELSLSRNYLDREKWHENDEVRVTITLLRRKKNDRSRD